MENKQMTYHGLVDNVKREKGGLMGINVPMLSMHYFEFAEQIGLDTEHYYHINKFIKEVSYADKRAIFENMGFDVLFMTLSAVKVIHKIEGRIDGNVNLNQEFLDKKRNIFVLDIEIGTESIFFVLEYHDPADPLANYTVDYEEVKRENERKEEMRALFNRMRKS